MQKIRHIIFLKDVLILAMSAIGGAHSHLPLFIRRMVNHRRYLTEAEFVELNALCQILPGPTSTQTITALGFKLGGPNLAYLTLIVWALPSIIMMSVAAILIAYFADKGIIVPFTKFIPSMAVGFVAYAAWVISSKVVNTKTAIILMIISSILGFFFRSPFVTPLLLFAGGLATTFKYNRLPKEAEMPLNIRWANFILFGLVFVITLVVGQITQWMPIKLFESFYRNGSMIFGGGQVLIPLLHTEYVELKHYLTSEEFLSGYAIIQAIPGPIFSISSYIGALSMREFGISGQFLGGFLSAAGIFLPGTFLIFFVYRIWDGLKQYRFIKASLEGINAVSSGLVIGVAIFLFKTVELNVSNISVMFFTFVALISEKIPSPLIILAGLLVGLIL